MFLLSATDPAPTCLVSRKGNNPGVCRVFLWVMLEDGMDLTSCSYGLLGLLRAFSTNLLSRSIDIALVARVMEDDFVLVAFEKDMSFMSPPEGVH